MKRDYSYFLLLLCFIYSSLSTHYSTHIPDQVQESTRSSLPYENLFRSFPTAGIIIQPDMVIVDANNLYFEITGLSKDIIGKSILDVSETLPLHKDSYESLKNALVSSIETKKTKKYDFVDHASRSWHVDIHPVFVPIGSQTLAFMQCHITDHTLLAIEKKENANLLEQLQNIDNYKRMVDAVSGYAIFIVDYRYIIRYWNRGATLISGWTDKQAEGRDIFSFYSVSDESKIRHQIANNDNEDLEATFYKADGSTFEASTVITPIMLHYDLEEKVGFAIIVRDLTQSIAGKEELKLAYEQAAQMKDEFTSKCSHDIRTPLNAISLATDALYATQLNTEQTELVYLIKRSTKKQLVHVNEILDFSKLMSGRRLSIHLQPIDLIDYLSIEMNDYKLISNENIDIRFEHSQKFPYYLVDQNKIQQIIGNLVSNGIKYTSKGHVSLVLSKQYLNEQFDNVIFEVQDSGKGVEAQIIETLFTPYTQVDGSNTQQNRGSGLGLSIVKIVVEKLDGNVYMKSKGLGFGTSVFVNLPLKHCQPPHQEQKTDSLESHAVSDGMQNILIAEDDDINRRLLVRGLYRLGYHRVDQVVNGKELIEKASFGHSYQLIITDVQMPFMSGIEAIRQFRTYDLKTPVLALTADGIDSNVNACRAAGMNDCIVKPIKMKHLSQVIARMLTCPENLDN